MISFWIAIDEAYSMPDLLLTFIEAIAKLQLYFYFSFQFYFSPMNDHVLPYTFQHQRGFGRYVSIKLFEGDLSLSVFQSYSRDIGDKAYTNR